MTDEAKDLDQFYTHPKVAERFVKKVDELYDLSSFDKVIEPSMGEGFIYDHLPSHNRIGLDIQKNHSDCLEGDFLKWTPDKSGIEYEPLMGTVPNLAFVGNPPFGRASGLALQFFKHCANWGDVVCFIIPRTWVRFEIHQHIPSDFGLYWQAILPDASFILKGKPYEVRCVAQCWSRYDPQIDSNVLDSEDWRDMPLNPPAV